MAGKMICETEASEIRHFHCSQLELIYDQAPGVCFTYKGFGPKSPILNTKTTKIMVNLTSERLVVIFNII